MPVRHAFESPVVDDADPNLVGPDEWNATHVGGDKVTKNTAFISDDLFFTSTTRVYEGGVIQQVNGTGATHGDAGSNPRQPGLVFLSTGTSTTGRSALASFSTAVIPGYGPISGGAVINPQLSDATNRFTVRSGIIDSVGGNGSAGIFFRYTDNVNSGKWQAVCRSGSSETAVDTGVTVSASDFYRLEWFCDAYCTEVEFYINDALVATVTTDIPDGADLPNLVPVGIVKSAGTTNRTVNIDSYWYYFEFDDNREIIT